jgi:hypothetical protein
MKEELKERLIKHISFLEEELQDSHLFHNLTWEIYSFLMMLCQNISAIFASSSNSIGSAAVYSESVVEGKFGDTIAAFPQ